MKMFCLLDFDPYSTYDSIKKWVVFVVISQGVAASAIVGYTIVGDLKRILS